MLGLVMVIGVFALVAIFTASGNDRRRRERELDRIRKRLAEKEAESTIRDGDEGHGS